MASTTTELKDTDKQICDILQANARIAFSSVAESVGLSVPAVSDHVRKLEEQGIIQGYHAKLNPEPFGFDITAFIFVDIESSLYYDSFIDHCRQLPEVLECHATTGNASHLLKIRTKNTRSLEKLLSALQQIKGVQRTITNLVLSTHIETFALNVAPNRNGNTAETSPAKKDKS